MGKPGQKPLKIIGVGKVVQSAFLNDGPPANCEFYDVKNSTRSLPVRSIESFEASESITVLCASAHEAEIIEKSGGARARLAVAKANLSIVRDLLSKRVFDTGSILVITNPSELIAEYIYRNSSNKNVYALGLGVDQKRYEELLQSRFATDGIVVSSLAGNHYDFPYPILKNCEFDNANIIESLRQDLRVQILDEFDGYRPPVKSGTYTLLEAIKSISEGAQLLVSGYCDDFECFSGGSLADMRFSPSLGDSDTARQAIRTIAIKHRQTYESLIQSMTEELK